MANIKHFQILKQGVEAWNVWRAGNRGIRPELIKADLNNAFLGGADLSEADLSGADLRGAFLSKADLSGAHLAVTNLSGAHLSMADLSNAELIWADLSDADLTLAILSGAFIQETNFSGANLSKADLSGAHLAVTNLSGAKLNNTDFSNAQVFDVMYSTPNDQTHLYRGIRIETSYGSPLFKRYAQDQDYLSEYRSRYKFWFRIWWLFADCGRSWTRWALWSLLFACLFGAIFQWFPGHVELDPGPIGTREVTWFTLVYYSVVTFTTLGFGDVTPTDWIGEILVTLEVLLGYFMLGGLISIFATKLARRS